MSYKQPYTFHQYNQELSRAIPMTVQKWRALKGVFYVVLMGCVATVGILEQQVFVPLAFILASMLIFGIEVHEIQIADYLSVTFRGADPVEDSDES